LHRIAFPGDFVELGHRSSVRRGSTEERIIENVWKVGGKKIRSDKRRGFG
jgi:hypothetical protein